jgi:hypothetical protein
MVAPAAHFASIFPGVVQMPVEYPRRNAITVTESIGFADWGGLFLHMLYNLPKRPGEVQSLWEGEAPAEPRKRSDRENAARRKPRSPAK